MDMSGDEDDTHSGDADSADHHWPLNHRGSSMTHKRIEEPLGVQEKQQRAVTFDARPTVIEGADQQTGMIRNCADRVKQLVEDIHSLIRTAQLNKRKVPFRAFRKVAFVLSYVMQIEGKRAAMNAMRRANAAPIKPHDRAPDSKWLHDLFNSNVAYGRRICFCGIGNSSRNGRWDKSTCYSKCRKCCQHW